MMQSIISIARQNFYESLLNSVLTIDHSGVPSNADKNNRLSIKLSKGIAKKLGCKNISERLAGQKSGNEFEKICADYIESIFLKLLHMRPGQWEIKCTGGRQRLAIAEYEQYSHLLELDKAARENPQLAAALGSDYAITPDITISRAPEKDSVINALQNIVDEKIARLTGIRRVNSSLPILHASVSCKWTIRSDRAQNSRSEGLNLVRNRKGKLPHIMVVTAEPTPNRIASLALGTGDIDCVYHFALNELLATCCEEGLEDAQAMLSTMIEGKRLRDISDLPMDLIV